MKGATALVCVLALATARRVEAQTCSELNCTASALASDWVMEARKLPFHPLTNASVDASMAETASGGRGLPRFASLSPSARPFRGSGQRASRFRPPAGFRIPKSAATGFDDTLPVGNLTLCTIDRVPDLDLDTFNRVYKDKKPVIFGRPYTDPNRRDTDARCRRFTKKENIRKNADWRAVMLYSVSGQARYQPKVWTLDRFLDFQDTKPINYSSNAEHQFQIFSHEFADSWPELRDACTSDPILESLYQQKLDVAEIGVGVKGFGLPWHWHTAVWANKIVHGRKRWYVSLIKDRVPGNTTNPTLMPWQWLTTVYPNMSPEEHEFLAECTVEAGEYIYVPHDLDHQTLNLEPGMFVTYRPAVLPPQKSSDGRPLKLDLAKECSRADALLDAGAVKSACERASKHYPSESEFRAFSAYAPYVLSHPSTLTLGNLVPSITQDLLAIRSNPRGATRATYQLLSILFTTGQCHDLIVVFTHIARHIDRDNTHSHMLFALCIRHLEQQQDPQHESARDSGGLGGRGDDAGNGAGGAGALPLSVEWWLDPSNTQSRLDALLSGQPYEPLRKHIEQPHMYERLSPEWRERFRDYDSKEETDLASALACGAYPAFAVPSPPVPPPSSAPAPLMLSPCDEEVDAVANDVRGRPRWQREVASALLHARALARRDTMSMSFTERFLHMFEVFRGLRLLDRPDLLTRQELAWFTLQVPRFDEQTFKSFTSYAERWHMADAVLGQEHVYRRWTEQIQQQVADLQNTRLEGITHIHSLLAPTSASAPSAGDGEDEPKGRRSRSHVGSGAGAGAGGDDGLGRRSHGASKWIADNQQQRQFPAGDSERVWDADDDTAGVSYRGEQAHTATAASTAATDMVVAAGLTRAELEAAKEALARPSTSPPSLAGLKKTTVDISGTEDHEKRWEQKRGHTPRWLEKGAPFPFEECEHVGVEEASARRACAMCLLEGCAYCTELQRCISNATPNVCPHKTVALNKSGSDTGTCPTE